MLVMHVGTVDDFTLHEGALKPRAEQYVKDKIGWLKGIEGVRQTQGSWRDE